MIIEGIPVRDWEMLELEEKQIEGKQQIALQTIAAASACLARLEKQQEFVLKAGQATCFAMVSKH